MAAGTMTITENRIGSVKKITAVWVSGSAGEGISGTTPHAYNGKCELLTTIPAAAGAAPTDDYDVTVLDADGTDVLGGGGANRDTANTEQVLGTSLGAVATSPLTITIANCGNSKGGTVHLYVR